MHVSRPRLRVWAPVLLSFAGLVLVGPVPSANALSAQVDPGFQTNGHVSSIVTVRNTVYIGGSFTTVRAPGQPQGTGSVPRSHLAAFRADTGALRSWSPATDGPVSALAASANGRTIYVGGHFATLNGRARHNLGAVSAKSGATTRFRANTNGDVLAIAATKTRVYAGGDFTKVRNRHRARLVATKGTGRLLKRWRPSTNGTVRTLAVAPGGKRLYAGGAFGKVNHRHNPHLSALSTATGKIQSWKLHPTYIVWDVVARKKSVYVAGNGTGGHVDAFKTNGHRRWRTQTDGGVQALAYSHGKVVAGGHFSHFCRGVSPGPVVGFRCPTVQATRPRLLAVSHKTGRLTGWNPTADSPGGVFALTPTKASLYAGGDFKRVSNRNQQGFAKFDAR